MARIELGVTSQTMSGETASADRHVVRVNGSKVLIAVVDGLGHGAAAVRAALTAVRVLEEDPVPSPVPLVRRLHEQLRQTRGVVIAVALVDLDACSLEWLGVGNVAGLLVHNGNHGTPERRKALAQLGGVVGHALPGLWVEALPIVPGDTLVFATDGIKADFDESVATGLPVQRLAQRILSAHRRDNDDALVVVARILGDAP